MNNLKERAYPSIQAVLRIRNRIGSVRIRNFWPDPNPIRNRNKHFGSGFESEMNQKKEPYIQAKIRWFHTIIPTYLTFTRCCTLGVESGSRDSPAKCRQSARLFLVFFSWNLFFFFLLWSTLRQWMLIRNHEQTANLKTDMASLTTGSVARVGPSEVGVVSLPPPSFSSPSWLWLLSLDLTARFATKKR